MKTQAELIDWLRDAYAMEKVMEKALTRLMNDEDEPLNLREQAKIHYLETQGHADAVVACLKKLGAETSALKITRAKGMKFAQAAAPSSSHDARINALLNTYAAEHFEIAYYSALRTGALKLEFNDIVLTCDQIILEETRMAQWLELHLQQIISGYLHSCKS